MRKQWAKLGKDTSSLDAELESIALSPGTAWLMRAFDDLNNSRNHSGSIPLPFTHLEIKAYDDLMQLELKPWDVQTIKLMDMAYLEESIKARSHE